MTFAAPACACDARQMINQEPECGLMAACMSLTQAFPWACREPVPNAGSAPVQRTETASTQAGSAKRPSIGQGSQGAGAPLRLPC